MHYKASVTFYQEAEDITDRPRQGIRVLFLSSRLTGHTCCKHFVISHKLGTVKLQSLSTERYQLFLRRYQTYVGFK